MQQEAREKRRAAGKGHFRKGLSYHGNCWLDCPAWMAGRKEGTILSKKQIVRKGFQQLSDFEKFRMEWICICVKLNKDSINAEDLENKERRAECLGIKG